MFIKQTKHMTHPLTDQKCELLSRQPWLDPDVDVESTIHDMRVAADWQLEQVVEWLQSNLWLFDDDTGPLYIKEDCLSDKVIDEDKVINDLRKAMRPQEDN